MKLSEILERRKSVNSEMATLYDDATKTGEDLAGEKLERWNVLDAERRDLVARESRVRARDELARKADAKPVEKRGTDDGRVFGLTREQRIADYIAATTGQSCDGLSIGRAVRAMITGSWEGADAERRVMGSTPGAAGGFVMPSPISAGLVDLMRNAAVTIQAGAVTIPMDSKNLRVVRVVSDPTAAWRGEGETIAKSDGSFDAIDLTAHSLAALVRVNAELLDDVPSFAATLDNMLAHALALKLDAAALYGNGVGQPLGLRYTTGINETSMGTDGAVPADWDKWLDTIAAVELANGSVDTIIWSPRTKATMAKIVTGITSDKTKLQAPSDIAALRKLASNQVSITETQGNNSASSTVFFGGFNNVAIGIRQNIQIEASRQSSDSFTKNQVHIRAIMRADVGVLRPAVLGRLVGVRAS